MLPAPGHGDYHSKSPTFQDKVPENLSIYFYGLHPLVLDVKSFHTQ